MSFFFYIYQSLSWQCVLDYFDRTSYFTCYVSSVLCPTGKTSKRLHWYQF